MLSERIERVRQRIARSCAHSGREPSSVTLVAVTKGVPVGRIRDAVALGLTELGENRVQEARAKQAALGLTLHPVRWHLIGHLQRNKARHVVERFDLIHSVDSTGLIEELERQAAHRVQGSRLKVEGTGNPIGVLVQVNVSGEASKFGCRPEEALALGRLITQRPHLHLRGFMTIAPFVDDPEAARPHFRSLRLLRDTIAAALNREPPRPALDAPISRGGRTLNLSMGMSQDFEVAIELGADIVRIGTAIFGPREHRNAEWGMRNGE